MRLKLDEAEKKKLIKALKNEPEVVQAILKRAVLDGAQIMQNEIEQRAPRRTGALAGKGFTAKASYQTPRSVNAVVTISGREFEYAFYNEFGVKAHNQPARPFIRRAFHSKRRTVTRLFEQRLKERYGN